MRGAGGAAAFTQKDLSQAAACAVKTIVIDSASRAVPMPRDVTWVFPAGRPASAHPASHAGT